MRVTIKDSTGDVYAAYAEKQGRAVDAVIEAQLARFATLPPGEKAIVVSAADAERILGGTPVLNGTDLLARVSKLAAITFHNVKLDFSPAQLAELQHRAERQGKSVEVLAQEVITAIARDFFWGTGGGEAATATVASTKAQKAG